MLNINSISTAHINRKYNLPTPSPKVLDAVLEAIKLLDDVTPVDLIKPTGLSQGCIYRAIQSLFRDNLITRSFTGNNGRYSLYTYSSI